jgi:hypothetical protein
VLRTALKSTRRAQFQYGQGVDKLTQYQWFKEQGIPTLEFTTSQQQAEAWWSTDKFVIFGRSLLNSSCGKGIIVYEQGFEVGPADDSPCPVYTLYKKKKREFRVHVFKDQVVCVVEKKRKKNWDEKQDTKIRNLANGYVFVQEVVNEPAGLRELALQAAAISPSDFRGVDIGYNEKKEELFVIEVNGQPGIMNSNVNKYISTILNYV